MCYLVSLSRKDDLLFHLPQFFFLDLRFLRFHQRFIPTIANYRLRIIAVSFPNACLQPIQSQNSTFLSSHLREIITSIRNNEYVYTKALYNVSDFYMKRVPLMATMYLQFFFRSYYSFSSSPSSPLFVVPPPNECTSMLSIHLIL
jgi:hypothetical protein